MANFKIQFLAKIARKQRLDQNITGKPAKPSPFLMVKALIDRGDCPLLIGATLVKNGDV